MIEGSPVTAILDASVLYPALLRNILMRFAVHGLFRVRWSTQIHEEWISALLRNRPDLTRPRVEHIRNLMDQHIQDALVTGYEARIEAVTLPDINDRHVLAAAIHCGATVIVTTNLRDFPNAILAGFGLEALHPDRFILNLVNSDHDAAIAALRQLRQSLKNPPLTPTELVAIMERQGLTESAVAISGFIETI